MIRTRLVDDEITGLNTLRYLLENNCPPIEILETCQDPQQVKTSISRRKPDLELMDMARRGKSGLEDIRELPSIDFEIIFVTAHIEYTIQAFKFSAVDYLLKPVDELSLIDAVSRAEAKIKAGQLNKNLETLIYNLHQQKKTNDLKICIPSIKGFQIIQIGDIICCEAENSYTTFHLVNQQKIVASKTLLEYEMLLEEQQFIRVHKSFLVNLQHVKEYKHGDGGKILLSNGLEIEVSRRKKEVFLSQMKGIYKL